MQAELQTMMNTIEPGIPAQRSESLRSELAEVGRNNLYFLCKGILGYDKLTEHAHGHFCKFLEECTLLRRMTQMPRSHFKTTIQTIGLTIQDVLNDPNIRILLVASSSQNAERFLTEIKNHLRANKIFQWLYPEIIPEDISKVRWNLQEMEVPRDVYWREPTIDTIGARGTVESRHYDIIRADDIIGEKEFNSDVEMSRTIEWSTGLESLLISPSTCLIDFVGTRWKMTDVYAFTENFYSGGEKPVDIGPFAYRKGELGVFRRKARKANGEPMFPELVSREFLDRLQRENPQRYAAQYANDPMAEGLVLFHTDWLRYFTVTGPESSIIQFTDAKGKEHEVSVWSMERQAFFDPAMAETKKACRQALMVVGNVSVDGSMYFFLLETVIGHYTPTEAVDYILEMDKKWRPDIFSIETIGYQGSIQYWLRERCIAQGLPEPPITPFPPKGVRNSQMSKDERIRGLQPLFRAGQFYIMQGHSEFIEEYTYYPHSTFKDALDALAQGVVYWTNSWDAQAQDEWAEHERKILARIGPDGYSLKPLRAAI